MPVTSFDSKKKLEELLAAGVHFGHLTRRWNPKMKPYIFMEKNGIHIMDLKKTVVSLQDACKAIAKIVANGEKVLFVGTKKQAKEIIKTEASRANMFYVTERWLGGMLTNFSTIRKSIKHMKNIEKKETDGTFEKITKKERLTLERQKMKLKSVLEGIEDMRQLPGAIFVVDTKKEHIAVKEANVLGIPVFAIVDTNCDPDTIHYVIPGNDDASKSIQVITKTVADAITEASQHIVAVQKEVKEVDEERVKDETRMKYEEDEKFAKLKGGKEKDVNLK
ncbi:30S ribosomal protein S2 [bacterium]|nr:30S ribosomal protein S2 [bacterium]